MLISVAFQAFFSNVAPDLHPSKVDLIDSCVGVFEGSAEI